MYQQTSVGNLAHRGFKSSILSLSLLSLLSLFLLASCGGGGGSSSSNEDTSTTLYYEDSPFGFHPGLVDKSGYTNNGYYDAQNIGVRWNRPSLYAFWSNIQLDLNDIIYDWSEYDSLYGSIPAGINILANVDIQPKSIDLAIHHIIGSYLPTDERQYINFVKGLIERYDGDGIDDMEGLVVPIKYWQVSNEPDDERSNFAEFMKITYRAIKESCPDCQVLIGGATAPADEEVDSYIENFDRVFLPILTELNGNYIDIFDFHWYGNAEGNYRLCKDFYEHIKISLSQTGFSESLPVWITEMGIYSGTITTGGRFHNLYQTEFQQAADYLKRFIHPLSFGVKKVFPAFGLMEGFKGTDGYFDHTGLIYEGAFSDDLGLGVKKLGYYTYKLMTEKLEGSEWDNIQTIQESNNVYIYKFTKGNNPIYVVWWDYFDEGIYNQGDTKTVIMNVDFTGRARITKVVSNADSGADLNEKDYPNFLEAKTETVVGGQVIITLGESPAFVEEENEE